jgi:Zn-dependent protease
LFGGAVWLVSRLTGPYDDIAGFVVSNLILVNVFWGLLNWAPIRPLDGGHLLTSLLEKVAPKNGEKIGNVVFLVTALGALAAAIWLQRIFVAVLAGWLVMGELSRGRERRPPPSSLPQMSFDPLPSEENEPAPTGETESETRPEPEH